MFIDRVYQTVKMLANTDGRGNVSPQDFNLALYNVISEKFEEYFTEATRLGNRGNRGLINRGLENMSERTREKIQYFLTPGTMPIVNSICTLPTDCRYIDFLQSTAGRKVEFSVDADEFHHIKQFDLLSPTLLYPIALRTGKTIELLPTTLVGNLRIYYLRNPKMPKWTYVVVNDAELFNPSAMDFQDIDMHPSEEDDIVSRLLIKFGINLKEPDLQEAGNTIEQIEFNQQTPM